MAVNETIRSLQATNIEGVVTPKNYLTNSFENSSTIGWNAFQTTLTSGLPTGSLTIGSGPSIVTTTTNPLSGKVSLQLVELGSMPAGDGIISDVFTVDRQDLGKVLYSNFSYEAVAGGGTANWSGVLGSQSIGVCIYDVTNSAWIATPPGFLGLTQNSGPAISTPVSFQTSVTSGQQYRVAILCLQTISAAVTINFDNFNCSRQPVVQGAALTDPVSYTATWTGAGTVTNVNNGLQWSRIGSFMRVYGEVQFGTVTAATLTFTLPNGLTVNSPTSGGNFLSVGRMETNTATASLIKDFTILVTNGSNTISFGVPEYSQAVNALSPILGNSWIANSAGVSIDALIPIAGWSSNLSLSNDTDTRVVAFTTTNVTPTGTINGSANTVVFPTNGANFVDTHGAYNSSTGIYTVSVSGVYSISSLVGFQVTAATLANTGILLFKNGTNVLNGQNNFMPATASVIGVTLSGVLSCVTGDQLKIACFSNEASITYGASASVFSVNRLSGPAVVAASESVNAKYTSATNTVGTSLAPILYPTKAYDSHNAYNTSTGLYTAPISGKYRITGAAASAAGVGSSVVSNGTFINITKNGTTQEYIDNYRFTVITTTFLVLLKGSSTINLNAGDTLAIYIARDSNVTSYSLDGTVSSFICIERVGQ